MAIVPYLLTRKAHPGASFIDGIQAMIYASDDAVNTTDALKFDAAAVKLTALGHPVPSSDAATGKPCYFDTKVALTTFDAAGDNAVFLERNSVTTIA